MMRVRFDEPRPLTCHILLNTACVLDCADCFYRRDESMEIPFDRLEWLLGDLASGGVKSVAFGGGEPTLYPHLNDAVEEAKRRGFYVAVTTNGAMEHYFYPAQPDRIHLSYSAMHRAALKRFGHSIPWKHIAYMLRFYRDQGITVGVNYIYHGNFRHFKLMDLLFDDAESITVLLKKPIMEEVEEFPESLDEKHPFSQLLNYVAMDRERFWLDACLMRLIKGEGCKQGISSFCIDQELMARRCSNTETKVPYTNLRETWERVRKIEDCILK